MTSPQSPGSDDQDLAGQSREGEDETSQESAPQATSEGGPEDTEGHIRLEEV